MLTRGEGVKNPENFADVIFERPLDLLISKAWQFLRDKRALTKRTLYKNNIHVLGSGFRSKHVLMLNDKHIVDWFSMPDAVSAMRFGKFGREDSSLVLITVGGSLTVKILRRTAQFENMEAAAVVMGPNARQVTNIMDIVKYLAI